MTIYLEDMGEVTFPFEPEEQIEKLAAFVTDFVKCPYEPEISVTLVDNDTIRSINKEYDAPADFSGEKFCKTLTVSPESEEMMLGDIVLCSEVVCEQAEEYGHSLLREFSFLVVHSLLHLFGYDHMEEDEREEMEEKQREIMKKLRILR